MFSWRALERALILLPLLAVARPAPADQPRRAESLYRRALGEEHADTPDTRRQAAEHLEQATLLAPDTVQYQLELARLYYRMGFLGLSRHRYERVAELSPNQAEAHLGLGLAWRRDYLKYLEPSSLHKAVRELDLAARLAPANAAAWFQLVPLLVERDELKEALNAAEHAQAADFTNPEGWLAVAHTAFRLGQVERADSAFRLAIPRLAPVARARYLDIAPLATESDTATLRRLPDEQKEDFVARFWKQHDPDLATPENEAQLEYWSRVTQAYFLYFNSHRQEWDQRGEVYVRYGPPAKAFYNPITVPLRYQMSAHGAYPMNVLVWIYPELGMVVPMQDRLLSEYYLPPVSLWDPTDPVPDRDSLINMTSSLATGGGRGVFPLLPPGSKALPVATTLARYEDDRGMRLSSWLESPGHSSDSLVANWVVLDSTGAEVTRIRRVLTASACDITELRAADFNVNLPPGEYLSGLSVHGAGGLRGVARNWVWIEPHEPTLEMSDLVITCGTPLTEFDAAGAPSMRVAASPSAQISGSDPVTAYFEAYHLATTKDGHARLEFQYTVRSAEKDPRIWIQRLVAPRPKTPSISAHREEDQFGAIRRQVVSVPIQSLPPGHYQLEIRVRDLNAGTEVARSAEFVKLGSGS